MCNHVASNEVDRTYCTHCCKHCLHYCKSCKKVYCCKCGKEWEEPCCLPHYPTYEPYPYWDWTYPYWDTGTSTGTITFNCC